MLLLKFNHGLSSFISFLHPLFYQNLLHKKNGICNLVSMAMFRVDGNLIQFFVDIDNDGIAKILKRHLCMFGNFQVSSLMVMRLKNGEKYHLQK